MVHYSEALIAGIACAAFVVACIIFAAIWKLTRPLPRAMPEATETDPLKEPLLGEETEPRLPDLEESRVCVDAPLKQLYDPAILWGTPQFPKPQGETLVSVLEKLSRDEAGRVYARWVNEHCEQVSELSYGELWQHAGAVADLLVDKGVQLENRVMVAYPFGLEFLAGLFGCMRAGVIACSVYPPNPKKLKTDLPKFNDFAADAGSRFALTTSKFAWAMRAAWLAGHRSQVEWLPTDTLTFGGRRLHKCAITTMDSTAFIQYTSGSTGTPKGVVISQRAVVHNIRCIGLTCRLPVDGECVCATWLPQYHDYGLVSNFLACLLTKSAIIATSPLAFISNPLIWADMIEKYKATHIAGPNFSYGLLARRLVQARRTMDGSSLVMASIAAEPILPVTLNQMEAAGIPAFAICPSYGGAESCVGVSWTFERRVTPEGYVSCGEVALSEVCGKQIVVVDPISKELAPDGAIGVIHYRGPDLASGYWNKLEASQSFHASIGGRDFFDSGDLGMIKEGHLYITGRAKEIIIINGKNVYPTDVESVVRESADGKLRPGSIVAFQNGPAHAAIVAEVRPEYVDCIGLDDCKTIVKACLKSVPKTTSGKIKRGAARERTINSEWTNILFDYVVQEGDSLTAEAGRGRWAGATMAVTELEAEILDILAQIVGEDDTPMDAEASWAELGLSSLGMVRFATAIENAIGKPIESTTFMTYSTPRVLAAAVTNGALKSATSAEPRDRALQYAAEWNPDPRQKMGERGALHPIVWGSIGVLAVLATVCGSAYPPALLYLHLRSPRGDNECDVAPDLLSSAVLPGWMLTFSAAVIVLKWLLCWRLKPGVLPFCSLVFLRWWFVHRLVKVWNCFVGCFLCDTPFLPTFYWMLGADIPCWNFKWSSLLTEPDLVSCKSSDIAVSSRIVTHIVTTRGVYLDRVHVKHRSDWPRDVLYPGVWSGDDGCDDDSRLGAAPTKPFAAQTQVLKCLKPAALAGMNVLAYWAVTRHFLGIIGLPCPLINAGVWFAALAMVGGFVVQANTVIVAAVLLVRLTRLDPITDLLFNCAFGFLKPFMGFSAHGYWSLVFRMLGGKLGDGSVVFKLPVAPSKCHLVSVGRGVNLLSCQMKVDDGPIIIGDGVQLGIGATLAGPLTVGRGAILQGGSGRVVTGNVAAHTMVLSSGVMYSQNDGAMAENKLSEVLQKRNRHTTPAVKFALQSFVSSLICIVPALALFATATMSFWESFRSLARAPLFIRIFVALLSSLAVIFVLTAFYERVLRVVGMLHSRGRRMIAFDHFFLVSTQLAWMSMVDAHLWLVQPFVGGTWLQVVWLRLRGVAPGSTLSFRDTQIYSLWTSNGADIQWGDSVVVNDDATNAVIDGHAMYTDGLLMQSVHVASGTEVRPGAVALAGSTLHGVVSGSFFHAAPIQKDDASTDHSFRTIGNVQSASFVATNQTMKLAPEVRATLYFWLLVILAVFSAALLAVVGILWWRTPDTKKLGIALGLILLVNVVADGTRTAFRPLWLRRVVGLSAARVKEVVGPRWGLHKMWLDELLREHGERLGWLKFGDVLFRKGGHVFLYVVTLTAVSPVVDDYAALGVATILFGGCLNTVRCVVLWAFCEPAHADRWFWLAFFWGGADRIRDGRFGQVNVMLSCSFHLWGTLVPYLIATLVLPSQDASPALWHLLVSLILYPVAIGDTMGEVVGTTLGRHRFRVCGLGEINQKSYEGCAAVFVGSLIPCLVAVATSNPLPPPSYWGLAVVVSALTMITEALSFRSSDNFTIPVFNSALCFTWWWCSGQWKG